MGVELSSAMIARLKERAANAERRSDSNEMAANSVPFASMMHGPRAEVAAQPQDVQDGVRGYLEGMNSPFSGVIADSVFGEGKQSKGLFDALGSLLGGRTAFGMMGRTMFSMGGLGQPKPAPAPATEEQVAAVEAKLEFALPAELRQFYLEVADGGVGPQAGIYSLKELVAKWREMTDEPVGPRGQKWPKKLLPVHGDRWDLTCIDRETGKLVYFDVEEIDYGGWKACFKDESESLEAWLDKWLIKPSLAEKAKRRAERPPPRQLSDEDWEVWAAESPLHQEYMRRLDIVTMTPEERRELGLADDGWEQHIWDGFDLTSIRLPRPGHADRKRNGEGV